MDGHAILGPVATLALWSMLIWLWMYATRIPAMQRAKIDAKNLVGTTGKSLDDVLPPEVQWKAHNYNHLMEQPTVFYAVALALAIGGMGGGLNLGLAWTYVALRIPQPGAGHRQPRDGALFNLSPGQPGVVCTVHPRLYRVRTSLTPINE